MAREDERIVIGADTSQAESALSRFSGKAIGELSKIKNATRLNLLANLAQLRSFASAATQMMAKFASQAYASQERAERQLRYALDQTKRYSEETERALLAAAKRVASATTLADEQAIKLMATLARVPEVPLESLEDMVIAIRGFADLTADSAAEADAAAQGIAESVLENLRGIAEGYGDVAGHFSQENQAYLAELAKTEDAQTVMQVGMALFTEQWREMGVAVAGTRDELAKYANAATDAMQRVEQVVFDQSIGTVGPALEGVQGVAGGWTDRILSRFPRGPRPESPAPAGTGRPQPRGRSPEQAAREEQRAEEERLRAIAEAERAEARMEALREELAGVEEIHLEHNSRMRELEILENEARRELEAGLNEGRNEQLLQQYELEREVQLQRYEQEKADLAEKLREEARLEEQARKRKEEREKKEAARERQRRLQAVHDAFRIQAHGHKGLEKLAKVAKLAQLTLALATEPRQAFAKTMAAGPFLFQKPLAVLAAATTAASILAAMRVVGGGGGSGGVDDAAGGGLGGIETGRDTDPYEPEEEDRETVIHLTVELDGDTVAQTVERVVRHTSDNS